MLYRGDRGWRVDFKFIGLTRSKTEIYNTIQYRLVVTYSIPMGSCRQYVRLNCLRDRAREMIEVHTRPSHARASSYAKRHEARPLKEESLTYLMQPEVISSCKCFSATEQFITQCCCFRSQFTCFLLLCPSPC